MSLVLPTLAFIFGWLTATWKSSETLKVFCSRILARFFIPFVIIYNMVYYQSGSLSLMLFSFISAFLVYLGFVYFFKDRLIALCASYVNLAWLGFPFALAIFGHQISSAMIALYIGGSLFGNIWAVSAVSSAPQDTLSLAKKVLLSPPVIALIISAILRLLQVQNFQEPSWVLHLYQFAKVGMVFTGMCVLGMWLRHTKVEKADLWHSVCVMLPKLLFGVIICSVSYFCIPIDTFKDYIGLMLFLFCLPPAANIVALETHYQGTGYSARYIAAGTIVSIVVILIFGLVWHVLKG